MMSLLFVDKSAKVPILPGILWIERAHGLL